MMRVKLDIEMCRKLLEVFTQHDRTSCTDQNTCNQYANSAGWVSCTRCWLLQAIADDWVPDVEFELYSSIKVVEKDPDALIGEYIRRINNNDPSAEALFEANKTNRDFLEAAKIVRDLKKKADEFPSK